MTGEDALRARVAELEARLEEAEETLDAIRSGDVDAVVVGNADARRVFTLESADRPYRRLVEEMREGAVTLSADGVLLYCNRAFADLVGRPPAQAIGTRFINYIARSRTPLDALLGEGGRSEVVLRGVDGVEHVVSLSLSALDTDDSRLLCGVVADLTEARARARDLADARQDLAVAVARRESEARYAALFDAIDAGFCVFDMIFDEAGRAVDYRFVEANPAFERQTGLSNVVGRRILELVPDLEEVWPERYGHVALTGEPLRVEDRAEAFLRWYDISAFRTGAAEQARVAVLFNDITARRTAEINLRDLADTLEHQVAVRTAELRQFRDIVEATTSPICAFDTDYRLIAFNQAHNEEFHRINGFYSKLGDVLPDLFIAEQRPVMRALMTRALAGERFTVREEFGRPELGSPVWEINYTPLLDEDGRVIGAFHLANDLSEQLRAEAELALAQEALRQSQKMEAMGQLTGGVAHDFNNLLTPIIGSLDMLQRRGVGSEREQRLIGGALQSADRAKTLVQRLLAFARRQPLKAVAVDIGALLDGMGELVASTSGPQINIVVNAPKNLAPACADANQLEMAILNLAVNARDAMPDGGTLSLSAHDARIGEGHRSGLPAGSYVGLSVADTGTGMDEETMSRAIEPFFSTKGIGKGTGLGLSMVHGLASQLGGAMTLISEPGLGTKVELWLPRSGQAVEAHAAAPSAPASSGAGRVLLVDDEENVRTSTADMLSDLGYEVIEAASAVEALKLLDGGLKTDLLLTDHLMPGMTGIELARTARERWPDCPVMLISGFAEAEGVAPDLPRLTKPFRQAELAIMLATLG